MPTGSPPPAAQDFLGQPNPAVVATIDPDGDLHTAATWYAWNDDGTVLLNMDVSRRRLGHLRADPRVALTVLAKDSWYEHLSIIGRVTDIREDVGLADIDRLSQAYTGRAYPNRVSERWSAIVHVDRWHGWNNGSPRQG